MCVHDAYALIILLYARAEFWSMNIFLIFPILELHEVFYPEIKDGFYVSE